MTFNEFLRRLAKFKGQMVLTDTGRIRRLMLVDPADHPDWDAACPINVVAGGREPILADEEGLALGLRQKTIDAIVDAADITPAGLEEFARRNGHSSAYKERVARYRERMLRVLGLQERR